VPGDARVASVSWVILTMGDRPDDLARAIESLGPEADVTVVLNGAPAAQVPLPPGVGCVPLEENRGVPGGRNAGVEATTGDIIGFLDDDAAVLAADAGERIVARFDADPDLAVMAFRLVDDDDQTARRHVPRLGRGNPGRSGPVAYFLGGACAIRRSDFEAAGRFHADLFYGHEELDLAWRILDRGRTLRYASDLRVFHPPSEISRHARGWFRTGRNRVVIARRNLPQPIALIHVLVWFALGLWRAPDTECRRSYLTGWRDGWSVEVVRRPIGWRTVARLTRLGRPPVV
jgi:hypothetical protein